VTAHPAGLGETYTRLCYGIVLKVESPRRLMIILCLRLIVVVIAVGGTLWVGADNQTTAVDPGAGLVSVLECLESYWSSWSGHLLNRASGLSERLA
jgi:hypothetical protein